MQFKCSKCGSVISDESETNSDRVIIKGICDECTSYLLWPNRPELSEFLDSLDAPVVVINSLGNVNTANQKARELLQKKLPDIQGFQGGNVFECAFAKLPEGCGKTIHCDGCTIRNSVMDTLHTGKSHLKIPAGLSHGTTDNYAQVQLLISTERINDVVMLRIDSIS
jgi:hypothetical protein